MSRELRICPGVGSRKRGAFLSTLDRDPHPTCTRCRGKVCTIDMTCDICADWSATQWEQFVKKSSYKDRKKPSRPSGSVPPAPFASPHGNSFGSFATWDFFLFSFPPFRWSGEEVGVSGCTWCCIPEGFLPSRWISVQREGWECFWTVVCCERTLSRFSGSFGS